jgi:hypothetical protein
MKESKSIIRLRLLVAFLGAAVWACALVVRSGTPEFIEIGAFFGWLWALYYLVTLPLEWCRK